MAWDKSGTKTEVESLLKRHPKKGIDPTIPAEIRSQLEWKDREEGFKKGEKNRYSAGGTTGGAGPRRASDPVPGTRGPIRPPSVPGGSAMPVGGAAPAPAPDYEPPKSPKLLQRALDERMGRIGKAGGGMVNTYAKGGKIDGCAQRGKTKGRVI